MQNRENYFQIETKRNMKTLTKIYVMIRANLHEWISLEKFIVLNIKHKRNKILNSNVRPKPKKNIWFFFTKRFCGIMEFFLCRCSVSTYANKIR